MTILAVSTTVTLGEPYNNPTESATTSAHRSESMVIRLSDASDVLKLQADLRIGGPIRVGPATLRWPVHLRIRRGQGSMQGHDTCPLIMQTPPMILVDHVSPPFACFTGTSRSIRSAIDQLREVFSRLCVTAIGRGGDTHLPRSNHLPDDPTTGASFLRLDVDPLRRPLVYQRTPVGRSGDRDQHFDDDCIDEGDDGEDEDQRQELGQQLSRFRHRVPAGETLIVLFHVDYVWSNINKTAFGVRARLIQLLILDPIPALCSIMVDKDNASEAITDGQRSRKVVSQSRSNNTNPNRPAPRPPPRPPPPPPPPPPRLILPSQAHSGRPAPPSLEAILAGLAMLRPTTA